MLIQCYCVSLCHETSLDDAEGTSKTFNKIPIPEGSVDNTAVAMVKKKGTKSKREFARSNVVSNLKEIRTEFELSIRISHIHYICL